MPAKSNFSDEIRQAMLEKLGPDAEPLPGVPTQRPQLGTPQVPMIDPHALYAFKHMLPNVFGPDQWHAMLPRLQQGNPDIDPNMTNYSTEDKTNPHDWKMLLPVSPIGAMILNDEDPTI